MSEYISINGPIPIDLWFEPAIERYFQINSGGMYTIDAHFPQPGNGHTYLTDHNLAYWIAQNNNNHNNVCYNKWPEMVNEVAAKICMNNPNAFDDIDIVQITFTGITNNEFSTQHAGYIYNSRLITIPAGTIYSGPVGIQGSMHPIIHETLHIIGIPVGQPNGFIGLPDRSEAIGWIMDPERPKIHNNVTINFDIMFHSHGIPNQYGLYATLPMISHDLLFLGWIQQNEIIIANSENLANIKLAPITYPLCPSQISDGFVRLLKLMIHENFSEEKDEYFLIEYHNGSEFDRNFHNLDEGLYNNGLMIWHIRERFPMLNQFSDHFIDIEIAVPYNGYYNNPIPDDDYPRYYLRELYYNGNYAEDYDWLDDARRDLNKVFYFMPDGGRHIWETTLSPSQFSGGHYPWDPTGGDWFPRHFPLKSDFFTDEEIRGHIQDEFTDATRPSSKDWAGTLTHIAVRDITKHNDYMTCNVYYNYWDGQLTNNTIWSGQVIVGENLIIPSNVSLTIQNGTEINFVKDSHLEIYGPMNIDGTVTVKDYPEDGYTITDEAMQIFSDQVILQNNAKLKIAQGGPRVRIDPGTTFLCGTGSKIEVYGKFFAEGTSENMISFTSSSSWAGIYFGSESSGILDYCLVEKVQGYGSPAIFIYNSSPEIKNSTIRNHQPYCYGIYVNGWSAMPLIYKTLSRILVLNRFMCINPMPLLSGILSRLLPVLPPLKPIMRISNLGIPAIPIISMAIIP